MCIRDSYGASDAASIGEAQRRYPQVAHVSVRDIAPRDLAIALARAGVDIAVDLVGHGHGCVLDALAPYRAGTPVTWVQEDPWNMGAWYFLAARLPELLGGRHPLTCVARDESASPATGSEKSHGLEQADILDKALA